MYFKHWIWIVKKLCMSVLWDLRVLIMGLILIVWALQTSGGSFTTHLGVSPFSKWRDNPSSSISFLHPFLFLSFLLRHPFHSSLWYYVCLLILVITCLSSSCVPSILTIYFHHHNHHIVFFSLPFRSELSHLLNHLVKFMSSGDLLWVLTLNC